MLVVLTNIPTPYRTAFFNVLHQQLAKQNVGFHVMYMAKTEPRRFWNFEPDENKYGYTFLKGFHPTFKNYYPHINPTVVREIKRLNPKWILLAGSWNAPSVVQVLLKSKTLRAKTIFWSEGHEDAQKTNNHLIHILRKWILTKFDAFVVPNKKSFNYVAKLTGNDSIGFLPNTVDEDFFSNQGLPPKDKMREELGWSKDDLIFLSVSTLEDRKGVLELIKGFHMLPHAEYPRLKLVALGTGLLEIPLKSYISENKINNIFVLGHKSPEEVRHFMYISDFFVLPTKSDPNPLTPIEASFMSMPIILSRMAGNHDEIIIESTGFSLDKIDCENITEVLHKAVLLTKEQKKCMSLNAYNNARVNFSRLSAAKNLIQFLEKL